MVLPSLIRFVQPLPGIGNRQVYVGGNQQNFDGAEPDFLYAMQPPLVRVGGIDYGFAYTVGFTSVASTGGEFQKDEIILINQFWGWAGLLDLENGSDPYYATLNGAPNIPVTAPGHGIGQFSLYSVVGYSDMAGKLAKFTYTSDTDVQYIIRMDATNGAAVNNTAAAANAVVNKPGALTLRYLLAEQTDDPTVRRKIPITQNGNPLYRNGGNITLQTVGGDKTFRITGRVGEKYSF